MILVMTFVMLFCRGTKLAYILIRGCRGHSGGGAAGNDLAKPAGPFHRLLEPFKHRYDVGYQVAESLISFGSGGFSGVGLGDSRQKLFFLPEAHTDFIGAIIGEELGFVGVALLVFAFVLILWRGLLAAFKAPDEYGVYLGVGITLFISIQAFTNLAVAEGMLPPRG